MFQCQKEYANNKIFQSKNLNKKFIVVKNIEDEPTTLAEVVVQNNMNFIPKISVIIPVHNNEQYIQQSLETVINQTLKEIEIICVDDGSTDDSLNILIKYALIDRRITVLKQNNLHAGIARNAGLSIAKGKYLSFLDSDDWFELNMLEEMYNKIISKNADIIICKCKTFNLENGKLEDKKLDSSLKLNLLPRKDPFSVYDVSDNIFQICLGYAWDKLFKSDFIYENNIRFQSINNTNDQQFTYTALCLAKSITTINKRLVIKRHFRKNSISSNRNKDPTCYLSSFEKIKSNLEKKDMFNLVKESFWKNFYHFSIFLLKNLDQDSRLNLFYNLHEKLNLWDYIGIFPLTSNIYRALHYIKNQNIFPTINIAYITNQKSFNLCLVSILSLLKNCEYENINIILLHSNITHTNINKLNKLKQIRNFTFQILNISDNEYINYPLSRSINKETLTRCILADKFPNIDKIFILDSDTIIMKSLLPLWEIDLKDKLIAAVEDILKSKDKAKMENLKDNFYVNTGVLLINAKKWRQIKFIDKINEYINENDYNFFSYQNAINILTDNQKIRLNPEFNYMEIWWKNDSNQYDYDYLQLYNKKEPTVIHFNGIKPNKNSCKNTYKNEFLKYYNILNSLNKNNFLIPIVLTSDDKYAPLMYTTMLSILENSYSKTFYTFYLIVSSNFSNFYQNLILKLKDNYKCNINFIFIKNPFEKVILKIPHITITTFYRLLVAELLPLEFDKCIYLDVDLYICKDLSELYNINIEDNYIAGVVSPSYYFNEEQHCKRLNLPSMKKYINAGMMIMNLKMLRKDNMTQKFQELAKGNYDSQDQDVINVACYGKILTLPPKYNAMVLSLKENNPLLRHLFTEQEISEANNSPTIIHYANKFKPWNSIGVYKEEFWWNIAKKTPFINNLFDRDSIYKCELKKWWFKIKNKALNIDNPKTFNEKIQWLKLYDTTPIKAYLSDKYLVRKWVKDKIGEQYLIPLLGIYNKFEEINFKNLPNSFVIKCNHGSEYTIIIKDKTKLNVSDVECKLYKWMNENYAYKNGLELQYRDIEHKIIILKNFYDSKGSLKDYEFLCFHGNPKFIWLKCDKNKYNLYELKSEQLPYIINDCYSIYHSYKKIKLFEQMIDLSLKLSEGFIYARISFHIFHKKIYFYDISFGSSRELNIIKSKNLDRKLGSHIILPKIVSKEDKGEYCLLVKNFPLYSIYILFIILISKLFKIYLYKF